jgi:hypothetical protein
MIKARETRPRSSPWENTESTDNSKPPENTRNTEGEPSHKQTGIRLNWAFGQINAARLRVTNHWSDPVENSGVPTVVCSVVMVLNAA